MHACDILEYFLYPQISGGPKSEAIQTIAKKLNLGFPENEDFYVPDQVRELFARRLQELERAAERFGFDASRMKWCRFSCALVGDGVSPLDLAERLGRSDPGFLLRAFVHVLKQAWWLESGRRELSTPGFFYPGLTQG